MTLTQAAGAARELHVFAPELIEDPYPWYAQLRADGIVDYTVAGMPNVRGVMLSRWADVHAVLRDPRFGRRGFRQSVTSTIGEGPLADSYSQWFLFQDPPDHGRLRGLVSKVFTPRAVDNMRDRIEAVVEQLLDAQTDKASFDLVSTFA